MTETEKLIIEKLDGLESRINERMDGFENRINERMGGFENRIDERLDGFENRINEKIDRFETRMGGFETRMDGFESQMIREMERLNLKIAKLQLTMENELSKKIDIIGEGHDFLKMKLDDALRMEKKRESMELEIINLRMEIQKIKDHLDIA